MPRANLLAGRNIQVSGPWGAILFYLRTRADNERFFPVSILSIQYTKGVIKGNILVVLSFLLPLKFYCRIIQGTYNKILDVRNSTQSLK